LSSRRTRTDWGLFIAAVLLAVTTDLVTKHLVLENLWRAEYLGGFLRITLVNNPGAAFGLFAGARGVFIAIKLVALLVILGLVGKGVASKLTLPLALIFGGALGNLIDRLRGTGEVIDFIDLGLGMRRWYVFNVADACISIGAALIVIYLMRAPSPRRAGPSLPTRSES